MPSPATRRVRAAVRQGYTGKPASRSIDADLEAAGLGGPFPVVRPSQLPSAGEGLFAARDYRPGERVVYYNGVWRTTLPEDTTYALEWRRGVYLDGRYDRTRPAGAACKVNHQASARANVQFVRNYAYLEVFLVAKRSILAGEELFCNYGRDYWHDSATGRPRRASRLTRAPETCPFSSNRKADSLQR